MGIGEQRNKELVWWWRAWPSLSSASLPRRGPRNRRDENRTRYSPLAGLPLKRTRNGGLHEDKTRKGILCTGTRDVPNRFTQAQRPESGGAPATATLYFNALILLVPTFNALRHDPGGWELRRIARYAFSERTRQGKPIPHHGEAHAFSAVSHPLESPASCACGPNAATSRSAPRRRAERGSAPPSPPTGRGGRRPDRGAGW